MNYARSWFFLFLLPALALPACGGEKPIDGPTGAVEEALPSGGPHLAGTYMSDSKNVGSFSQLVLKTNGTFHAMMNSDCIGERCTSVEQNGRFVLYRKETITYFELYGATLRVPLGRYQYMLQGESLSVRKLGSTDIFTPMARSPAAWCAVTQDCALQDLQIGPCAGQYICTTANLCTWLCGPAPEIAGASPKPATGG
jgi:hypothetical protein